jgi:putative ATP-binding cassette transporter
LPDGRSILDSASLRIEAGDRVLVNGPSGSGKTTLFRALAGIWPYGTGTVLIPQGQKMLFLPQRPYLPIGTLREVLSYPDRPRGSTDGAFRQALVDARLSHFIDRLDEQANWSLELFRRRAATDRFRSRITVRTRLAVHGRGHVSPGREH